MKSMTGFGRFYKQIKGMDIDVSIRSVNSRFLDIKIHSPKIYGPLEIEIRKKISQKIKRGYVEVFISRRCSGVSQQIHFNEELAKNWLKGFHGVSKKLKLEPVKDSMVLLQIPDFIFLKPEDESSLKPGEKAALFKIFDRALSDCFKIKDREGVSLKRDLKGYLQALFKQLVLIKKMRGQVLKDLDKKYKNRLGKLGFSGDIDPQRLAQEIVIQMDKSDISEEIQRLETHIEAAGLVISGSGSLGKKLDFYAQELLREINTIGSKSANSQLTQIVVESKTLVEKYREQVQNVE